MKNLSDFNGVEGIEKAAAVLGFIIEILTDEKNQAVKNEKNPVVMFTEFMKNSPKQMQSIFAVLSEKEPSEFDCNGSEALINMLTLANDHIVIGLFVSQGQTGDAKSSGSVSGNTAE